MMAPSKPWKNASTLILTVPQTEKVSNRNAMIDYGILMLKRSSKSSFFPNALVFPGGGYDKTDSSNHWLEVFQTTDSRFINLLKKLIVHQSDGNRSPMMRSDMFGSHCLSPEIAFRICAIRETFEETGILIARSIENDSFSKDSRYANVHEFKSSAEVESWRRRICTNPADLMELFKTIRCIPDVWSLHEWSNWLTPYINRYAKRYDTFFYTAALDSYPKYAREDNVETTKLMVEKPSQYLKLFKERKCLMGPPQIVELSRFLHYRTHKDLIEFVVDRGLKGMSCWLPVLGTTADDVQVSLYPGDYWYPENIDQNSTITNISIPVSYESMISNSLLQPSNHSARISTSKMTSVSTNTMPYGQLNPKYFSAAGNDDSKL